MENEIKEAMRLAEEVGRQKEQGRIAKEFYDYAFRESLPIEVQKDLMRIIGINIE